MPLLEVVSVADTTLNVDGPVLGAHLEMPRTGRLLDGTAIETWGWVVARDRKPVSIDFRHDGRLLRRVPLNLPRPDVAQHYPNARFAEHSGFRTEIPIAGRAAEFRVEVTCTFSHGPIVPVGHLVIRRRWRDALATSSEPRIVSIVIPCFNQAHYLGAAIASACAQTYSNIEVVVIDDGSADNTGEVARRFERVRYVRQENQGLAAARNTGIRRTIGSYLVFLDADDRLLPQAVERGLASLDAHPEAAFTSGLCRWIAGDGSAIDTPKHGCSGGDNYASLLRTNYTGMPATVMFRRSVFEVVTGFSLGFSAAADYELLLRIAREFPVCCHDDIVAEYRVHAGSMSADAALMLEHTLRVVRSQRAYVRGDPQLEAAYRDGLRFWTAYYGGKLRQFMDAETQQRRWRHALHAAWQLARWSPRWLFGNLVR